MARFYITTAISYTNAGPHIGHALEMVQADAVARYRRMMGDDVRFLTGTDEHGTKIQRTAEKAGVPTQEFVDSIAAQFGQLAERLNISNTDFIRTSDRARHWPAAQKIWQKMAENDDIYKKSYIGLYCVGHESFIKESELIDGVCPLHKTAPERIEEENWFFRLTKYKERVRELIESDRLRIVPTTRKSEVLNLLDDAEDVSFSRPSAQLSWGIPVPGDDSQTMYVWADALTNYISALGYGTDEKEMLFWPAQVHLIGKDIVRFHTLIWPAMLLSAGLDTPEAVYVHGFVTVEGEKMSKSLGNVIDPFELVDRYPADVIRYFMLRELRSSDDSDFSMVNLESRYVSDLANGLGNLVQRTATLIETKLGGKVSYNANLAVTDGSLRAVLDDSIYRGAFEAFRLHDASANIWEKIGIANAYMNDYQPWKQEGSEAEKTLMTVMCMLVHIARLLEPFMPATARTVLERFGVGLDGDLTDGEVLMVKPGNALFPRTR
jgi:methionyl-tRNA synthetase